MLVGIDCIQGGATDHGEGETTATIEERAREAKAAVFGRSASPPPMDHRTGRLQIRVPTGQSKQILCQRFGRGLQLLSALHDAGRLPRDKVR